MAGTMPKSLEELLSATRSGGPEKTASAARPMNQSEIDYGVELAMLDKFAAENITQEDMLKIAAHAKISGEIMSDVTMAKLASVMPLLVKQALEQVLPQVLPRAMHAALQKIAVGDSEVISGSAEANNKEAPPAEQTKLEDQLGKNEEPVGARALLDATHTQGAQVSGGEAGVPIEDTQGNTPGKMAFIDPVRRRQTIQARQPAAGGPRKQADIGGLPGGEGGEQSPEALLQMLLAKQMGGQQLSPEEMELLQQLQAMLGGGAPGMERQAAAPYTQAQRAQALDALLRQRLGMAG